MFFEKKNNKTNFEIKLSKNLTLTGVVTSHVQRINSADISDGSRSRC